MDSGPVSDGGGRWRRRFPGLYPSLKCIDRGLRGRVEAEPDSGGYVGEQVHQSLEQQGVFRGHPDPGTDHRDAEGTGCGAFTDLGLGLVGGGGYRAGNDIEAGFAKGSITGLYSGGQCGLIEIRVAAVVDRAGV